MSYISSFKSVISITSHFTTNERCYEAIIGERWGREDKQDVVCPYCGQHNCHRRADGRFCCSHCKSNFSCLVGTIFENTKVPLVKWFVAMYLISSHKKGISSHQLARDIECTQKTAWYMLQKIRTLYTQDDSIAFEGDIELDEVYIGGKEKWRHKSMRTPNTQGRSTATKTPVFGIMERSTFKDINGNEKCMSFVHAFIVSDTKGETILPIVEQFVEKGSTICTDEMNAYKNLKKLGYEHRIVRHKLQEFSKGDGIFTNTMEGFWSHFRRMLAGAYHHVSDKYMQRYIDEAAYRWNVRFDSQINRFRDMFEKSIGKVNYCDVRMEKVA